MIVEIARLTAKPDQVEALRAGLVTARAVIARAPGYLDSVFYQGVEEPASFLLRVHWETLEAHMTGFRESALFKEWRSHFFGLLAEPPKMTHYAVIAAG